MVIKVNVEVVSPLSNSDKANSLCSAIQSDINKIENFLISLKAHDVFVESFSYEAYVK